MGVKNDDEVSGIIANNEREGSFFSLLGGRGVIHRK